MQYPVFVMDFDHRDPARKRFNIANTFRTWAIAQVVAEIQKCDVVCANCHRMRTYGERIGLGRLDSNQD